MQAVETAATTPQSARCHRHVTDSNNTEMLFGLRKIVTNRLGIKAGIFVPFSGTLCNVFLHVFRGECFVAVLVLLCSERVGLVHARWFFCDRVG